MYMWYTVHGHYRQTISSATWPSIGEGLLEMDNRVSKGCR